jgi:hypothetical protein
MSNAQSTATTSTIKYFNGNRWPIHLVISELNVTLHLKPGEPIQDVLGRNINDSFFDKYTRPLQLSKEISKNGPVPLIAIPRPKLTAENSTASAHSVHGVSNFSIDSKGQRQPVIPPQKPVVVPAANSSSLMAMSVEEARRRGFIGRAREVPEDYGVTDTSGRPVDVSQAPPIKYAMESTPKLRQSETLPAELLQTDGLNSAQASVAQKLVSSLSQAASSNVESPTGFMNQTTVTNPPTPIQAQPPVQDSAPEPEDELPAPNIFNQAQIAAPETPVEPAAPKPAKTAKAPVRAAAPKDLKEFVCSVDGESFRYRSQLKSYAEKQHPQRVEEILAPYPPEKKK